MNSPKKWVQEKLINLIRSGGSLVDKAESDRRRAICEGCPRFGQVEPLPLLKMEGCTICGCPFATKGFMKTILRLKGREDEALSIDEILALQLQGFSDDEFVSQLITCPHEDGDLWAKPA